MNKNFLAAKFMFKMANDCKIVSINEDDDWDIAEQLERIFKEGGVRIASNERMHEVCLTEDETVLGGTVIAQYNEEMGPTIRFSVAVDPKTQRQGIARRLVESIINEFGGSHRIEAWVVNPNMVSLLSSLGFDEPHGGWNPDNPFMERN